MPGGIIQVVNSGSEDVYLTGNPQITFFKTVHRRHTNFATEMMPQYFITDPNFGDEVTSVIEKIGDLMGKIYLEIEIPEIKLTKNYAQNTLNIQTINTQYVLLRQLYDLTNQYIESNVNLAKKILLSVSTDNIYINDVAAVLLNENFIHDMTVSKNNLISFIENNAPTIQMIFGTNNTNNTNDNNRYFAELILRANIIVNIRNIIYLQRESNEKTIKDTIKKFINNSYYLFVSDLESFVNDKYAATEKIYDEMKNLTYAEYYKSAWVEELAHSLIDTINYTIGNQVIESHTGDWFIIQNSLYNRPEITQAYNELIGNVDELTNFNDEPKKSRKIYLPLIFSFCRHTGLAIPLVSLRYHDLMINLALKDLSSVFYTEDDPILNNMQNIQSKYNINLQNGKLYVEYIFLDTEERRRFARSSHEYLIETLQYTYFNKIDGNSYLAKVTFSNPVKYIVWFVQPSSYRNNKSGHTKCQWNNFGIFNDKTGNPIENNAIKINNYDRISSALHQNYFNFVQPLWHFISTPPDGLNIYSYSFNPIEHQPSGTNNHSRIDDFIIQITFSNDMLENHPNSDLIMGVYAVAYNILRFFGGVAGLSFVDYSAV